MKKLLLMSIFMLYAGSAQALDEAKKNKIFLDYVHAIASSASNTNKIITPATTALQTAILNALPGLTISYATQPTFRDGLHNPTSLKLTTGLIATSVAAPYIGKGITAYNAHKARQFTREHLPSGSQAEQDRCLQQWTNTVQIIKRIYCPGAPSCEREMDSIAAFLRKTYKKNAPQQDVVHSSQLAENPDFLWSSQ